jgi:hypothetical protein
MSLSFFYLLLAAYSFPGRPIGSMATDNMLLGKNFLTTL